MDVTTPALLFSSISLLLLAYTNRFFVLAKLVRDLHADWKTTDKTLSRKQIPILRRRLKLIQYMQSFGVFSFLLCTAALFCLFLERLLVGKFFFGFSVIALLVSLSLSLIEVVLSTQALDIVLNDLHDDCS